jgi:hypothetical protein
MIDLIQWSTGAAAGAAGSATSTGYSMPVRGKVLAVHVDYQDSPPATTDITLSDENDPAAENIVTLADQATDIKVYPRRVLEQNNGTDLLYAATFNVYGHYVVHGRLKAVIAQADSPDFANISVWLEC